jgi:hypothetical protein
MRYSSETLKSYFDRARDFSGVMYVDDLETYQVMAKKLNPDEIVDFVKRGATINLTRPTVYEAPDRSTVAELAACQEMRSNLSYSIRERIPDFTIAQADSVAIMLERLGGKVNSLEIPGFCRHF